MSKFCNYCDNLLSPIYDTSVPNIGMSKSQFSIDVLKFHCKSCAISYKPTDIDTLRYHKSRDNINSSLILKDSKILTRAVEDPTVLKIRMKCIRCDSNTFKQVRMFDTLQAINICIKCGIQISGAIQ
jgi:DNA-directed RNA polymerase subunit M/transcription elongation factor TFIIS